MNKTEKLVAQTRRSPSPQSNRPAVMGGQGRDADEIVSSSLWLAFLVIVVGSILAAAVAWRAWA